MRPRQITMDEYLDERESYGGYCVECQDFTRENTEPDAQGYRCPVCGQDTVMGAELAFMTGEIEFCADDDEEDKILLSMLGMR